MSGTRCVLVVLVTYVYLLFCAASHSKKKSFEAILENADECKDVRPPYSRKFTFITKYKVNVINGKRFISGNSIITAPTPFKNFSARTFEIDKSGRRELKMQISQVSCRNIVAIAILKFINVSFSTKPCMLQRGNFRYENLDLNKIMHAVPGWHAPGNLQHQLQLVVDGVTEFCTDIFLKII